MRCVCGGGRTDTWLNIAALIIHGAPEHTPLIRIAREVNDGKVGHVLEQASLLIDELPGVAIACFGLAFKANIDDFRESPALKIAAKLARRYGGRIKIVEPFASELPAAFEGTGAELIDIGEALETCPVMITLTDHDMFKSIPLDERANKVVCDTGGIWSDQPDNLMAITDMRLARVRISSSMVLAAQVKRSLRPCVLSQPCSYADLSMMISD